MRLSGKIKKAGMIHYRSKRFSFISI